MDIDSASQPLEGSSAPSTPKPRTKAKVRPNKTQNEAVEPVKELLLKAKMRDPEQIALYQKLLRESQLTQTEFIIDRCLNTGGGNGEVPIINIQAYHELGQCRLLFEKLIERLNTMTSNDLEPLVALIDQLERELTAIRATRKAVVNLE